MIKMLMLCILQHLIVFIWIELRWRRRLIRRVLLRPLLVLHIHEVTLALHFYLVRFEFIVLALRRLIELVVPDFWVAVADHAVAIQVIV